MTTFNTNKKYRNRQRRYLIVTIVSLILTVGSFIHDYYEEEEYPRAEGFIDVNDFWGTHILTRKTFDCTDTLYSRNEEIVINWDMYSEAMTFGYKDKYQECGSSRDRFRFYTGDCFLSKNIGERVKATIHQLVLMKQDSLTESAPFRYEYRLQVVGNIETFTWKSSRKWLEFDRLCKEVRISCPNMVAGDY